MRSTMMQTPPSLDHLLARAGGYQQVPTDPGSFTADGWLRSSTGKFMKTKLREQFKDYVSKTPA